MAIDPSFLIAYPGFLFATLLSLSNDCNFLKIYPMIDTAMGVEASSRNNKSSTGLADEVERKLRSEATAIGFTENPHRYDTKAWH